MWPFGRDKNHDLIDTGYLNRRGISEDYRDAFNRKKKDLKAEVKRNERIISENKEKVTNLETEIRTNLMKKSELQATAKAWADDDTMDQQEIQKLGLEIDQITTQMDFYIDEQDDARETISNCLETVNMLNSIISGTKKTPKQLTDGPIILEGGNVENKMDKRPRSAEVADASEYLEAYGSSKEDKVTGEEE